MATVYNPDDSSLLLPLFTQLTHSEAANEL